NHSARLEGVQVGNTLVQIDEPRSHDEIARLIAGRVGLVVARIEEPAGAGDGADQQHDAEDPEEASRMGEYVHESGSSVSLSFSPLPRTRGRGVGGEGPSLNTPSPPT